MAGQAAGDVGLAVSAWQLTGAVGIVVVGFSFLPRFLRAGIYTMPEYLEYRYNAAARAIMSVLTVVIYAAVTTAAVLYSGATTLETVFGMPLPAGVALIASLAVLYTLWGGLLAAVWADLFQGSALLVGGLATFAPRPLGGGGWSAFTAGTAGRLHMILPRTHAELPWTVLVGGMWIPIVYYCGLNQFIVQRTLAARSLRQGQLGIVFAAALWLLDPVRDRHAGHPRAAAVRRAARPARPGLPGARPRARPDGPARLRLRGPRRRGDQHARVGAQLGVDDRHDGPLQAPPAPGRARPRARARGPRADRRLPR